MKWQPKREHAAPSRHSLLRCGVESRLSESSDFGASTLRLLAGLEARPLDFAADCRASWLYSQHAAFVTKRAVPAVRPQRSGYNLVYPPSIMMRTWLRSWKAVTTSPSDERISGLK